MHGKVCLITGATSGIGKAMGLADMGASFVWTECFVSEDKAAKAGYVGPGPLSSCTTRAGTFAAVMMSQSGRTASQQF
jgi:NAD(P)-dependent dehydrogenase (short-subunit alcohol dehydrogenase family)